MTGPVTNNVTRETGVVLIHALGRTKWSMALLARRLRAAGWPVALAAYPSLRLPMADAAERVAAQIARHGQDWRKVHLVGHSLGGLLARRLALSRTDLRIGRVVQIGSPNAGTAVGNRLVRWALPRWVLGPVLAEVAAVPRRVERAGNVGAIAGTGRLGWLARALGLYGPNDGLVTVRSAWSGAAARAAVPVTHSFLPMSAEAARLTNAYLSTGRFEDATA